MSQSSGMENQLSTEASPLNPPLPNKAGERLQWGKTSAASLALAISHTAKLHPGPVILVAKDTQHASRLEHQICFFLDQEEIPVKTFVDWETLPYDVFSPLPELVSQRLLTLHWTQSLQQGVMIVTVATLMQRLLPASYLDAHSFLLDTGSKLPIDAFRLKLEKAGYQCVSQVMSHGEFAVRGSLLDIYPMGAYQPYRIDLFDEEIDSIRSFDPETQRSDITVDNIRMLPAREFPVDDEAIALFRRQYRNQLEGDLQRSLIYRGVSDGSMPGGIEYYLPLFYEQTATLFDYLPDSSLLVYPDQLHDETDSFFSQISDRYEQRRHDIERPLLPPGDLYLTADAIISSVKEYAGVAYKKGGLDVRKKSFSGFANFRSRMLPGLNINARADKPAKQLQDFLQQNQVRTLFIGETAGRREALLELLRGFEIHPTPIKGWADFISGKQDFAITAAPVEDGLWLDDLQIAIIPEALLLGERVQQERRRRKKTDADLIVRNLTELNIGAPVVHEDHGVGRYLGLQHFELGGLAQEFLTIEYARGDKLYVPVASLHLISRYSGAPEQGAPLHKLGGDQWEKAKRKAAEKIRDVAAELLEVHARRAARKGHAVPMPGDEYRQFASEFEFEETPDQQAAIDAVIGDMTAAKPMDRVVCGDVGFGKTEVAMRAAFLATQGGKQVAVLVPTTLLAQQHYENFSDRFADWPVKIESLSRFRSASEVKQVLKGLMTGTVDIVIGTHKLLSNDINFKDLGLVIIDEEHRFGVRHKERLKTLRAEVDMLTLTATPIPRTLNMAMSGLRDLSIIATPPAQRHPIKTFVSQWNDVLISEACQREIKRGGQVYFLHNDVSNIEKMARQLEEKIPGVRAQVAHGQMRERELEAVMRDFYHQRFNLLVCTTIIESGIDVPTANTIIINRADKLGLAQLHQLRGRVGRSHHRAYAYLITPPPKNITADAKKRLEALESLEDLGAGFTLSTHDLEIRGAGELLGDEQSGQIHEIGFTLYTEMLERSVQAIKAGRQPELDRPLDHGTEIDLHIPALLPENYLPDVHIRLIQYKRIASAEDLASLRELKVEMIDRFGLLPDPAKALFDITALKLRMKPYGIRKIEAGPQGGRIIFDHNPQIEPARIIQLIQSQPKKYQLDGADKLKFTAELSDPGKRVDQVANLLDRVIGMQ